MSMYYSNPDPAIERYLRRKIGDQVLAMSADSQYKPGYYLVVGQDIGLKVKWGELDAKKCARNLQASLGLKERNAKRLYNFIANDIGDFFREVTSLNYIHKGLEPHAIKVVAEYELLGSDILKEREQKKPSYFAGLLKRALQSIKRSDPPTPAIRSSEFEEWINERDIHFGISGGDKELREELEAEFRERNKL